MPERHVILLHGLFRTRLSLLIMQRQLSRAGYTVVNRSYRSTRKSIEEHAASLDAQLRERYSGEENVSLDIVTHSLGGIVARAWLAKHEPVLPVRRLVMLGPPNRGVQLVDRLRSLWLFGALAGRSGLGLGRDEDGPSDRLGRYTLPPQVEVGIIAGGTGNQHGYAAWIEGDNDGVVEVESTHLDGAADHILLPHLHTFIMNAADSIRNVLHFLENGRFCADAVRLSDHGEATP